MVTKITVFLTLPVQRTIWWDPVNMCQKKLHFLLVSLYRGLFGGPVGKVGAEIALLDTSASIVDHLVAQE